MSGPVWMYRKGEAKIFASPEEIPANEGWVDSPALIPSDDVKPQKKRKQQAEPDGNSDADSDPSA